MSSFENKVLKNKKLDKELTLRVMQNDANGRIFVEFASEGGKLLLQKSFQDTASGKKDAENFQKSIRSIADLMKYFGLEKKCH